MNLDSKEQQQKEIVSSNQFINVINYKITIKTVCGDKEIIQELGKIPRGILLEDKQDCTITIEKFSLSNSSNFFHPVKINESLIIQANWDTNFHKIINTSAANYKLDTEVKHIKTQ